MQTLMAKKKRKEILNREGEKKKERERGLGLECEKSQYEGCEYL